MIVLWESGVTRRLMDFDNPNIEKVKNVNKNDGIATNHVLEDSNMIQSTFRHREIDAKE